MSSWSQLLLSSVTEYSIVFILQIVVPVSVKKDERLIKQGMGVGAVDPLLICHIQPEDTQLEGTSLRGVGKVTVATSIFQTVRASSQHLYKRVGIISCTQRPNNMVEIFQNILVLQPEAHKTSKRFHTALLLYVMQ